MQKYKDTEIHDKMRD